MTGREGGGSGVGSAPLEGRECYGNQCVSAGLKGLRLN